MRRELHRRVLTLSFASKVQLVLRLLRDGEVPATAKLLLPLVVAYIALPFDIVPDDVPVLGQIDDVLVIALGLGLFVLLTPEHVLDQHLAALE